MNFTTRLARASFRGAQSLVRTARAAIAKLALAIGLPPSVLIRYDLIPRSYYALPLLLASVQAQRLGLKGMTIIELGVGAGGGTINLCELTTLLNREFNLDYRIVGLDSGAGLPDPRDFRDHPEIWRGAQFVHDKELLQRQLTANAKIVYGEVRDTAPQVLAGIDADHPLGFLVVDLDYYTSTRDALEGLMRAAPEKYLPAVVMYADDVEALLTFNGFCGEALAFDEFNEKSPHRKIERKPVRTHRKSRTWHRRIYCCHVLDHPVRHAIGNNRLGDEREINVLTF